MTEKLLHYIWQFQHYNKSCLLTNEGNELQVIHPGTYNLNQGPDFLNARIIAGGTTWVGSIELHVLTSDWKLHNHSNDHNYRNVILHVVWKHDLPLVLPFPTLELQPLVPKLLLKKHESLMQANRFIPCEKQFVRVNELVFAKWKERLLVERLQKKTTYIETLLHTNKWHWEETCWWMLSRNFGSKVNSAFFEKIAMSIPLNILVRHRHNLVQLEALLLGQAGLLDKVFKDAYVITLQQEYRFLRMKYNLVAPVGSLYFLRMRPANFPTVRLAQLAAFIHQCDHLFSAMLAAKEVQCIEKLFDVAAGVYWDTRYQPDVKAEYKRKHIGKQMIQNLLINTVVPMVYAYGYQHNDVQKQARALTWLEQLLPEKNNTCKGFEALGVNSKTAYDSQALIQLKNEYCDQKRCLECSVGNGILTVK